MIRRAIAALAAGLCALAATVAAAQEAHVAGSATYRERIILPRDAVLEVVLQDVSRPDAPAVELARVEAFNLGNPPYRFRIPYERSAIDDRRVYAVRAAVRVEDQLVFTSETFHPVLTLGAPDEVEIVMVRPGGNGQAALGATRSISAFVGSADPRSHEGAPEFAALDAEASEDEAEDGALRGYVTFVAEAARFTDCTTGREHRIAEIGDYEALEHAYVAAGREPGGPMMASFEGEVIEDAAEDNEPLVQVDRFVGIWPGEDCEPPRDEWALVDTPWQFLRLRDAVLDPQAGRASPHLTLQEADSLRFSASVGCNTFIGTAEVEDDRLRFGPAATTMIACPPELDLHERTLDAVLREVQGWRIEGDRLELLDADGVVVAELAVAGTE